MNNYQNLMKAILIDKYKLNLFTKSKIFGYKYLNYEY